MLSARERRSFCALEKKSSLTVWVGVEAQATTMAMATTIRGISGSYGVLTEYEPGSPVVPCRRCLHVRYTSVGTPL